MEKSKKGILSSIRFRTKPRTPQDLLEMVVDELTVKVKAIEKELISVSNGIPLTIDGLRLQYKSSDELWRYFKFIRDQENYIFALFLLLAWARGAKIWKLKTSHKPSSPFFDDFKKVRARMKRFKDERAACRRGVLFHLLGLCLQERIHLAEPVSGAKEPSAKPEGAPSGILMKNAYEKGFQLKFDPAQFCKKVGITLPGETEKDVDYDDLADLVVAKVYETPSDGRKASRSGKKKNKTKATERNTIKRKKIPEIQLERGIYASMLHSEFRNPDIVIKRKTCRIYRVRSDNHGMFRALAFSLALGKISVQQESRAIYQLRELACQELLRSCEEPYMSDGTTVKQMMTKMSKLKVHEVGLVNVVSDYYKKMLLRKKPGTLELWALSRALRRKIVVFEKVILDQKSKSYADYFKHNASYGTDFESEVFLYKNGKGEYASLLLLDTSDPKKQGEFNTLRAYPKKNSVTANSVSKRSTDIAVISEAKQEDILPSVGESKVGRKPLRLDAEPEDSSPPPKDTDFAEGFTAEIDF